jgi:hypothetical protein
MTKQNISSNIPFSNTSIELTKSLSKTEKKEQGIFFTPPTIVDILLQKCLEHANGTKFQRILEPSAGSGEIIRGIHRSGITGATIDAVEYNPTIYARSSIDPEINDPKNPVRWFHTDFIQFPPSTITAQKYDLIPGNPPYLVVGKETVPPQYAEYMVGRPNLFGLFIVHSISLLADNGILAFVIPKSFLNSAYYATIRNYMKQNGELLEIVDFTANGGFMETQQATIGMIYCKKGNCPLPKECPYSIRLGENFVFSENAQHLRNIFVGSTTLSRLGLAVKTGNIVWNQKKELLTEDSRYTLLVYNSNITDQHGIRLLDFERNDAKKQWIQMEGSNDMVIVVNRGNGNSAYKHTYALVNGDEQPYLVENHLNVVYARATMSPTEKMKLFHIVLQSFEHPKTNQFIQAFLGNNGLSKTELETIFPIFIE